MKKSFLLSGYFLTIAVCFIIPLIHLKSTLDPVLYPRLLALGITIFVLACFTYLESGQKKIDFKFALNGYFIAFLFFILISIGSLFFAINPIEGLTDIFKWILFFLLTLLATNLMLNSDSFFNLLLKAVVINALLFTIVGFVQYFDHSFLSTDPNALYEVKGLMAHKNQFSISLFVLIPFLLSGILILNKTWKNFVILALVLVLMLILILQTRAVWLALVIGIICSTVFLLIINSKKRFIQLKNKRQKQILIAISAVTVLIILLIIFYPVGPLKSINNRIDTVFNPAYTSNEWRLEMWDATTQLMTDQSFWGVGAGNWKISVYPYYSEYLPSVYRHWRNPHNDYLLTFSEKGLLGLVGFASMFGILLFYAIRNAFRSETQKDLLIRSFLILGVLGYMVISFFSFPNERINHLIFMSLIAAYLIFTNLKTTNNLRPKLISKTWFVFAILIGSYLAIHFGFIAVNSEINIVKAQSAQDKKDWNSMEKYAEDGYSILAPIEPKFSFPVAMYTGIAKYQKGEFKESLTYFKESYQQHPTNISVMNNIGSVYGQMGIIDSAIVYQQRTLAIFPHYEFGLLNLAKAFYMAEDYSNAYQTILSCDPKSTNQEVHKIRMAIENKLN